ncbi:MAG: hypothetical protein KGI97_07450, partial [Alphaproteobacteria bacterium]|nr:hypothetical protein [Alphaproteobacteria bacterium]
REPGRREEARREEPRREPERREEARREEPRREPERQEEARREEPRREPEFPHRPEARRPEERRFEPRTDEGRREAAERTEARPPSFENRETPFIPRNFEDMENRPARFYQNLRQSSALKPVAQNFPKAIPSATVGKLGKDVGFPTKAAEPPLAKKWTFPTPGLTLTPYTAIFKGKK